MAVGDREAAARLIGDDIRRVMVHLEERTAKYVIVLALRMHEELVKSTPVRTGWARANWRIGFGAPPEGTVGSPNAVGAAEALQDFSIASFLANYRLKFGPVYITNHVPYIRDLDEGSSPQRPAGWVGVALRKGLALARASFLGLVRGKR